MDKYIYSPPHPNLHDNKIFLLCVCPCLCNLPCQTIGHIFLYVIYGLMIIGQKTKIYHKFPVQRVQLPVVKGNVSLKDNIMNNNVFKN